MSNNFKKLIKSLISNRESTCEKLQPKILKIIHCPKLHVFIAMGVIIKSRCKYLKMITNEGSFRGVYYSLFVSTWVSYRAWTPTLLPRTQILLSCYALISNEQVQATNLHWILRLKNPYMLVFLQKANVTCWINVHRHKVRIWCWIENILLSCNL
jgi:hypothetical protein